MKVWLDNIIQSSRDSLYLTYLIILKQYRNHLTHVGDLLAKRADIFTLNSNDNQKPLQSSSQVTSTILTFDIGLESAIAMEFYNAHLTWQWQDSYVNPTRIFLLIK